MNRTRFEQLLAAAHLPTGVSEQTFEALRRFLELRRRWAGAHNVSGPRALEEAWQVDVVDGFAVAQVLHPTLPLVDVGSGSGVPGLVVAVLEPEREVVLVEPLAKKAALLRTAARTLGLERVRVRRERWPVQLEQAVQVVSRAVVAPAEWPTLALSGGEHVATVLRMLAAERPAFAPPGFRLTDAADYRALRSDRRVERWDRG